MKKIRLLGLALGLGSLALGLASCGGENAGGDFDPKNNTIGYQWEDTTKPILADSENEISFKITSKIIDFI